MITIRARPSGGSQRRGAHQVSQNASGHADHRRQVGPAGGEVVLADDSGSATVAHSTIAAHAIGPRAAAPTSAIAISATGS
jgi:hypothetical protein